MRYPALRLWWLVLAASANACGDEAVEQRGGADADAADASVAGSPLQGRWTGTTDDGGPVAFEISSDGRLVSFDIELEISVGLDRCTGTFRAEPNARLQNGRFELVTELRNAAGTVQGAIKGSLSGSSATGDYDIDSFAIVCGGSLSFGSGGPSGTFTATNRGGTVVSPDVSDAAVGSDGANPAPGMGTWTPVSEAGAPSERSSPAAVWSGSEMIVWGGYDGAPTATGGRYDPVTDTWRPMAGSGAPTARSAPGAVWTGSEMIIWGAGNMQTDTGARYDPGQDRWMPMSSVDAPSMRYVSVAVWTGAEMLVWGGFDGAPLSSGARYDPAADRWTPMSMTGAPSGRNGHALIWTGREMIVFGGNAGGEPPTDAGRYDPESDRWTPITMVGAPTPRSGIEDALVWTGDELIVWGGWDGEQALSGGGRYDPVGDRWAPIATADAPRARTSHCAVWTGTRMILWGGATDNQGNVSLASGGIYHPGTDGWTATTGAGAPAGRDEHVAIWTGAEMIVWGGNDGVTRFGGARFRL